MPFRKVIKEFRRPYQESGDVDTLAQPTMNNYRGGNEKEHILPTSQYKVLCTYYLRAFPLDSTLLSDRCTLTGPWGYLNRKLSLIKLP